MSDTWLRRTVILVTTLLVLHHVGVWAYSTFGVSAALVSAALVAMVSAFSAQRAGNARNNAWFLVPTLLFTLVPLTANIWALLSSETNWWGRVLEFVPFLIGFAVPVLLLLVVYVELQRRLPHD